jgi:hypothetical protein
MIGQGTPTNQYGVRKTPWHCRILAPDGGGVRTIEYRAPAPPLHDRM